MHENRVASLVPVTREFRAALGLARLMGLGGNRARIRANHVVRDLTGHDCMELMQLDFSETPETDPVESFLDERCSLDPEAITSASKLYAGFKKWYSDNVDQPENVSQKRFGGWLRDRFGKQKSGIYYYKGIRLMED